MSGLAECDQETDHVMTAGEAALMLRLSRDSLYAAANRGDIPHRRVGRRMLFSRVALMTWLQGSSVEVANDEIARRRKRAA